jgi:MFS family permease
MLTAFRSVGFRRLWLANVFSLLSAGTWVVLLPMFALRSGFSGRELGAVLASSLIGMLLCLLVSGYVSDKYPKRSVMLISSAGSACVFIALFAVLNEPSHAVASLAVAGFLLGVIEALYGPASEAIVPEVADRDDLTAANSWLSVVESLAAKVIGPALAGGLSVLLDPRVALLIPAGFSVLAAVAVWRLPVRVVDQEAEHDAPVFGEIKKGFTFILRTPWVWTALAWFATAVILQYGARMVSLPLWFDMRGRPEAYALAMTVLGLGSLAGAFFSAALGHRFTQFRVMMSAWTLGSFLWLAVALAGRVWVALVTMCLIGFTSSVGNIIWQTLLQRDVPDNMRARVASADWFASISLMPVSTIIAGSFGAGSNAKWFMVVAAVLPTCTGLLVLGSQWSRVAAPADDSMGRRAQENDARV